MTELTASRPKASSTGVVITNDAHLPKRVVDFHEAPLDSVYSRCFWYVEPAHTLLHHGVDEFPAAWTAVAAEGVRLCVADSMLVQQQPNAEFGVTEIVSTASQTSSNAIRFPTPIAAEEFLSAILRSAVRSNKGRVTVLSVSDRYLAPSTPVGERVDELILEDSGQEDVLLDRREQAAWLKDVLSSRWGAHLPQPFIGFDLDDGLFVASWQSADECNTLTIDAKERIGWYDPWPASESDNPMPGEIQLDTEEAWERLRTALTTTRL